MGYPHLRGLLATLPKKLLTTLHLSQRCHTTEAVGKTIFSGIQPTGSIHLGNYLGAIRDWVRLQNEEDATTIYSIVDLHAITLAHDPPTLRQEILKMAATLFACGIDPNKSILYQQSRVIEHPALCWVLACLTTLPRLGRLQQYKEKAAKFTNKSVPTGLFIYPILQTADILLHKATHVPVGEDQTQHIQLSVHLASLFNSTYGGHTFPLPKTIIQEDTARIKSLRAPTLKMSKSDSNPKSRIELLDTPEDIREKVKKAVTDFTSAVYYDPENRPGVSNLMGIHSALTGTSYDELQKTHADIDTGKYKTVVAEAIIEHLTPIRARALELMGDGGHLESLLEEGRQKAQTRAADTLKEVYAKVGFVKHS